MQAIYKIKSHPIAGGIPDIDKGASPGMLSNEDKQYLRELAKKVSEITAKPQQEERKKLWKRHNALKEGKPLVLVYPEDSWYEIIPEDSLRIADPYWKQMEFYLRHTVYREEIICDDYVVEPELVVLPVIKSSGWGLEPVFTKLSSGGSFVWMPPLKELEDINKLRHPIVEFDEVETRYRMERMKDVFEDILPVSFNGVTQLHLDPIGIATTLRGIEQVMIDIYDEPEWLHELIAFITEGLSKNLDYYEANGLLRLNNKNHYTGSGGLGYSDELPSPQYDGKKIKLCDMWAFGLGQEFSEVSPSHHEEFLLDYQLKILDKCGLVAYGCCEPYTYKFKMLEKVKNLRRISISPWCDIKTASEKLGRKYIYSWKPNPSMVTNGFDDELIRRYVRNTVEAAKDNVLEIILKDTITLENNPNRLETWMEIARDEIKRLWE